MNKDKVYLKGYVIGRAVDTLGYEGLMVQLENLDVVEIDKNLVHRDINEPQKVTVPQFVADWIEKAKKNSKNVVEFFSYKFQDIELIKYFKDREKIDIVARAYLDGYTVEEDKQYEVILCNGQSLKTVYRQGEDRLDFEKVYGDLERFTRKQLEEAGFGWVFDCPGIGIKEVKE